MAIYQYHCETCGIEFEFMKIRSNDIVECPKCEEKNEKKLKRFEVNKSNFVLKGRGWAKDRYGK